MSLPKQLKIGAFTFDVGYDDRLEENSQLGRIDLTGGVIGVRPDMALSLEKITLMHEVIHGIMFTAGLRDMDERIVDILAHGFVQVLQDNPELTR